MFSPVRSNSESVFYALYSFYRDSIKNITQVKFGRLMGKDNYQSIKRELRQYEKEKAFPYILSLIDDADQIEESHKTAMRQKLEAIKLLSGDLTLNSTLSIMHVHGNIAQADYEYSLTNNWLEYPTLSLLNSLNKTIEKHPDFFDHIKMSDKDKALFLNQFEKITPLYKALRYITSTNKKWLSDITSQKLTHAFADALNANKLSQVGIDLSRGYNDGLDDDICPALTMVLDKRLFSILSLILLIKDNSKPQENSYSRGLVEKVWDADGNENKEFFAVVQWLSSKDSENGDFKLLEFYIRHAQPASLKTKREPSSLGWYEQEDRGGTKSIDHILSSNSPLSSPVIATYLLNNLASTDFSTERFYACLYVIQRQPALKILCDKLSPLLKVVNTHSYDDYDLTNDLVAAFVLQSKAKIINSDINDYYEFLISLVKSGQRMMVLNESPRMLVRVNAACNDNTRVFSELLKRAASGLSESVVNSLPAVTINAMHLLLSLADELSVIDVHHPLLTESTKLAFELSHQREILNYSVYSKNSESARAILQFGSKANYGSGVTQIYSCDGFANFCLSSNATVGGIEECILPLTKKLIKMFSMSRTRWDNNVIGFSSNSRNADAHFRTPKEEMAKLSGLLRPFNKLKVEVDDYGITMSKALAFLFLEGHKMSDVTVGFDRGRATFVEYIIIGVRIIILGQMRLDELLPVLLEKNISTIEFYQFDRFNIEHESVHSEFNNPHRFTCKRLVIDNITSEDLDHYSLFIKYKKAVDVTQYADINPTIGVVKGLVPQFYYLDHLFNAEGRDYAGIGNN